MISISTILSIFSLISVLLILPIGTFLSNKARETVILTNENNFESLRSKQHELLQLIMKSQSTLANIEVRVDTELAAFEELDKSKNRKQELSDAEDQKKRNVKAIAALEDDLIPRLGVLEKEAKSSFAKELEDDAVAQQKKKKKDAALSSDSVIQSNKDNNNDRKSKNDQQQQPSSDGVETDENGNQKVINNDHSLINHQNNNNNKRYVVKYHTGATGVVTTDRMRTIQEATVKYDSLGDVAKKLLTLPSSAVDYDEEGTGGNRGGDSKHNNWLIVRQNGGQQWLSCMTNDAVPQPGACRGE